jgi:tetratricopeptide (TPR) repeat protein
LDTDEFDKKGEIPMLTQKKSTIPSKRLFLFRMTAMIAVPIAFLLLVEIGLRLSGFGYPTNAIVKSTINGKTVYRDNYSFGRRFISKKMAPQFVEFVIEPQKPGKTYRIFILGSSAALGFPDPSVNFGNILEIMLRQRYPGTNFEVINTAITAMNSHVFLPIAKDCAKYEPDMFIVYMGNNEVVGPFGPGTTFTSLLPSLGAIRANIWLKSTRTGQLIETIGGLFSSDRLGFQTFEGMVMFLDKQVRYNDPALKSVYSHFEQNLKDICETGIKAGAKVVVSNVAVNLKDSPPFASLHRDGLTDSEKQAWEDLYQKGVKLETAGDYEQAIEYYLAAEKIDETFANLQFRLGKCLWNTGQYEDAKTRYTKAMEYDTLRFRADRKINEIISSVAKDRTSDNIYFVDAIKAIENNSPHNTPGNELFYEHAHYKFEGNYTVGRSLFEQIEKLLPESITQSQKPGPVLTEKNCEELMAYTGWDRYNNLNNLMNSLFVKPPFTNQLYHNEAMDEIEQTLNQLNIYKNPENLQKALALYETSLEKYPHHWQRRWKYCWLLEQAGKGNKEIVKQLETILQTVPVTKVYEQFGLALYLQGDAKKAIEMFKKSIELKPTSSKSYVLIGNIYRDTSDFKKAVKYYSKAIAIEPASSIDVYTSLAHIYYTALQTDKAVKTLRHAVKVFPEKQTAKTHYYLGEILYAQDRGDEAREEYEKVLKIDPNNTFALQRLKQLKGF